MTLSDGLGRFAPRDDILFNAFALDRVPYALHIALGGGEVNKSLRCGLGLRKEDSPGYL
jgi:hypothetical protein